MTYKTKRRIVRLVITVILFAVPFLSINGNPVLRFDFREMSIYVLGVSLEPAYIFPSLLLIFSLLFFFIFATQIFGRIWCGWLCPQTLLLDFASDISLTVKKRDSKAVSGMKKAVNISARVLVSVALTVMLMLYSMPPADLLPRLAAGDVHIAWAVVCLLIFLEITFIGRIFCKTVCPYSTFQAVMYDADTMRVAFLPERQEACIKCGACVRVCPTGIDIRDGLSNKCVLCAACADACTDVMKKLDQTTCVDYMFGRGKLKPFTPNKIISFGIACLFLIAALVSFSKIGGISVRIADVRAAENGYDFGLDVTSRFPEPVTVYVYVEPRDGVELSDATFQLNKGETRRVVVTVSGDVERTPVVRVVTYRAREEIAQELRLEYSR